MEADAPRTSGFGRQSRTDRGKGGIGQQALLGVQQARAVRGLRKSGAQRLVSRCVHLAAAAPVRPQGGLFFRGGRRRPHRVRSMSTARRTSTAARLKCFWAASTEMFSRVAISA